MTEAQSVTEDLKEMLASPHYHLRWGVLASAVEVIAGQAARIAELERASAAQGEPIGTVRHYNVGGSGEYHSIQWASIPPGDGTKLFAAPPDADKVQDVELDREADRRRYPDEQFNKWLDEGISDAGHTVWHQIQDVNSAWHGWENSRFYVSNAAPSTAVPEELLNALKEIDHISQAFHEGGYGKEGDLKAMRQITSLAQIWLKFDAAPAQQAQPVEQKNTGAILPIMKFQDLPLGTRFRYIGGREIWVVIERYGLGLIAKYEPHNGWVAGQSICSFADSEEELQALLVEVVDTLSPAPSEQDKVDAANYRYLKSTAVYEKCAYWFRVTANSGSIDEAVAAACASQGEANGE